MYITKSIFDYFLRKSQWLFDVSSWNRRRNLPCVCKQYLRTMNRKNKYWKQERHSDLWKSLIHVIKLCKLYSDLWYWTVLYDQYGHCTVWNIYIVKIFIQITYHLRSDVVDNVLDMYILYPFSLSRSSFWIFLYNDDPIIIFWCYQQLIFLCSYSHKPQIVGGVRLPHNLIRHLQHIRTSLDVCLRWRLIQSRANSDIFVVHNDHTNNSILLSYPLQDTFHFWIIRFVSNRKDSNTFLSQKTPNINLA